MVFGHGDRMGLMVKNFGRQVVIDIRLGEAKLSKNRKRLTITFPESQSRKIRNKKSK
jgi:hypothetical protein